MNYLEWVNQDVKRSYRHREILQWITNHEKHIAECHERIAKATAGITPPERSTFRPAFIDTIFKETHKGFMRYAGASEGEIYLDEMLRKQEKDQHDREFEIKYCTEDIERYRTYLTKRQTELLECEQSKVASWLKMPRKDWAKELHYRIMDNGDWTNIDCAELDSLFFVLDEINADDDVETTIRTHYGFICTMSIERDGKRISVTRKEYALVECLQRTMLTFFDLAWEYLMPKEVVNV